MKTLEYSKVVSQPQLAAELVAAGVPSAWDEQDGDTTVSRSLVVQIVEHGELNPKAEFVESAPASVEIVVPDSAVRKLVDKVVADHVPAPIQITQSAPTVGQKLIAALEVMAPDKAVTAADLLDMLRTCDAELAAS